jgi:hypothetical protein
MQYKTQIDSVFFLPFNPTFPNEKFCPRPILSPYASCYLEFDWTMMVSAILPPLWKFKRPSIMSDTENNKETAAEVEDMVTLLFKIQKTLWVLVLYMQFWINPQIPLLLWISCPSFNVYMWTCTMPRVFPCWIKCIDFLTPFRSSLLRYMGLLWFGKCCQRRSTELVYSNASSSFWC